MSTCHYFLIAMKLKESLFLLYTSCQYWFAVSDSHTLLKVGQTYNCSVLPRADTVVSQWSWWIDTGFKVGDALSLVRQGSCSPSNSIPLNSVTIPSDGMASWVGGSSLKLDVPDGSRFNDLDVISDSVSCFDVTLCFTLLTNKPAITPNTAVTIRKNNTPPTAM